MQKPGFQVISSLAVVIVMATGIQPVFAGSISPLSIIATFDSSITSDPNAASIENTIDTAITFYETTFTTATAAPINVSIEFQNISTGLGQSQTAEGIFSYQSFDNA